MRINNNVAAFNAYRNLSANSNSVSKSLEKLSSGLRINRASDDAAGLVISQNLRSQVSGLTQATRNAQDGISVVQTAEGALNEVHNMLGRMRDLAVQASNTGSNDSNAVAAAQAEYDQLAQEITRISDKTKFGGTALLDGSYGVKGAAITGFDADNNIAVTAADGFSININGLGATTVSLTGVAAAANNGASVAASVQYDIRAALAASGTAAIRAFADKVTVTTTTVGAGVALNLKVDGLTNGQTFTLSNTTNTPLATLGWGGSVTAASGTGGTFQVGANSGDTLAVSIGDIDATALGVASANLSTGAAAAITALDTAISTVSTTRGTLGATQNRFESVIANLQVATENLTASESRIRDTDYSQEMVKFTKGQILNQAATSMLSQANKLPQGVLSLLQG